MTDEKQYKITTFGLEFVSHDFPSFTDKRHPLYRREIMVAICYNPFLEYGTSYRDNVDPSELKNGWPEGVDVIIKEYNTYVKTKNSPFDTQDSFLIGGWKIPQTNLIDIIPEPKFGVKSVDTVKIPNMMHTDEYRTMNFNNWLITDQFDMILFRRGIWHLLGVPKTEALPR